MSIEINRDAVLRYLSYRNSEIPIEIDELIDSCIIEALEKSNPRYVYRELEIFENSLKNTKFQFESDDIKKLLENSSICVLMGATLGMEVDALIMKYSISDLTRAVVLDACCSVAIESLCDNVEKIIGSKHLGMYLTDRFSPGYGDFSIESQRDIFSILNLERTIGLNLSSTGIMIPRKSVTAVLGISKEVQSHRNPCEVCNAYNNCIYRDGVECGEFER